MPNKHNRKNEDSGINEKDLKKLILMLDKMGRGIELLYYLIDNKRIDSFVTVLLSANEIDLKDHIDEQKRDTDILFEINKDDNLYALLCQETEVDGGYYFMQRLIKTIEEKGGREIYCSEVEVKNTKHDIQEIVFRLLNMYRRTKVQKDDGEINFYTLR